MIVLDASALLAFLQGEPGDDRVEEVLDEAVVGAANWSEVAQKVRASGADWGVASGLLLSYRLRVEPVSHRDAERQPGCGARERPFARRSAVPRGSGARLDAVALTADRAWGESKRVEQLRR